MKMLHRIYGHKRQRFIPKKCIGAVLLSWLEWNMKLTITIITMKLVTILFKINWSVEMTFSVTKSN